MSLRMQLTAALAAAGLAPNHRLGQNFMVDKGALDQVVAAADPRPGERALEIGPGTGFLTERLLAVGVQVCAVELDRGLYGYLCQRFAAALASGQLTLIHGDALASKSRFHPAIETWVAAGKPWRLVANLPYDIAIPAILNALALANPPQRCAVTVQYEAAQRLCAAPGTKAWGASAAVAQSAGRGAVVAQLPPRCFYPQPRVQSGLLCWYPQRALPSGFANWCRQLFAYRRKVISRALRDLDLPREAALAVVAERQYPEHRRVEQLSVEDLLELFQALGQLTPPVKKG